MIAVQAGSHVYKLLQMLAVAGEYPRKSLALLGNVRVVSALVHRLEATQDYWDGNGGQAHGVKLIKVSPVGKGKAIGTIRLCKKAVPILDWLHPGLSDIYLRRFDNNKFSGNLHHIGRNHRVAEAIAICMSAGIETRPYVLSKLQRSEIRRVIQYAPSFYIARDFKFAENGGEANKTMFTRIIGALFYPGGCYAIYNIRDAVMKWGGTGELKAALSLLELARMNAGLDSASAAMLFGASYETAVNTLLESEKSKRRDTAFDQIYPNIHFVPQDSNGIRLIKILTLPSWREKLLSVLFDAVERTYGQAHIECDAIVSGVYVLSHLDSDIARLF
jgi:hypothetical protein